MINDFSIDDYVIINKVFLSSFIAFLTTYLIAVVQLLPELGQVANIYFKDCIS
ncbi:unnamed protein product [Nezara viridula]|uniref:Uncharacterized protein n=1 Tax=Nezara viridula TaxID=85310 RepID=A0A9P0MSK5_NEZVI|nr:unnamed protein product [Nezara viridula]